MLSRSLSLLSLKKQKENKTSTSQKEVSAIKMLRAPQQLRSGGRGGAPRFALEQEEQEGGRDDVAGPQGLSLL